ncbi:hypothetical protein IDH44_16980 [Paenibacillus sp. IB182496]|uniref:Uncharacterized protein n=1 Tax=Paenibacillus sabuli TaxID=2772509 RepID=A0A927BX06_9BACL|nr:hypothetical protein [Paenibacillus sabuli]MBD2846893.1 hypothetical protein [Paenibacillus sabuli]
MGHAREYRGQTLALLHGSPLIAYTLTDAEGLSSRLLSDYALYRSVYKPGDELSAPLETADLLQYNLAIRDYLLEAVRPSTLPPGTYTVTATADYRLEDERQEAAGPEEDAREAAGRATDRHSAAGRETAAALEVSLTFTVR